MKVCCSTRDGQPICLCSVNGDPLANMEFNPKYCNGCGDENECEVCGKIAHLEYRANMLVCPYCLNADKWRVPESLSRGL